MNIVKSVAVCQAQDECIYIYYNVSKMKDLFLFYFFVASSLITVQVQV